MSKSNKPKKAAKTTISELKELKAFYQTNPETVKCVMCWTMTPTKDVEYGKALGCSGAFCDDCKGWLTSYEFETLDKNATGVIANEYITDEADTDSKPYGYKSTDAWDDSKPYHTWLPICHHNLTPYELPQGTVYLSGYNALIGKHRMEGPVPTAALYLTYDWMSGRVVSNCGVASPTVENSMEITYAGWPDHGIIPIENLTIMAVYAEKKIKEKANLEIACYGGHGRTGTMVAAIGILGGWTTRYAIDHIRTKYCAQAIESESQEMLLAKFWQEVNNAKDKDNQVSDVKL